MMLVQPSSPLAKIMVHQTVLSAAPLLIGPVAVAELSMGLPALTGALLEKNGR